MQLLTSLELASPHTVRMVADKRLAPYSVAHPPSRTPLGELVGRKATACAAALLWGIKGRGAGTMLGG